MMKVISAVLFAAFAFASPVFADKIALAEISNFFNGFRTAEAEFTQINGDGSKSTGTLYIHRPGRARFEYDPPEGALVMAGGGQVAIFDPKSNSNPEQYPLRRTPLSIILARKVDFSREKMVVAHEAKGETTIVTAQDPKNPEYGTIQLVFTGNPVKLQQWVITNGSGDQTKVVLGDLRTGTKLSSFLFNITHEVERWRN